MPAMKSNMRPQPQDWPDIDLHWAYGDLLTSIRRRTGSVAHAYDVLHEAFVRFAVRGAGDALLQPKAYMRAIVNSVLADGRRDGARWLPYPDCDPGAEPEHPDIATARGILARTLDPETITPSPEYLADLSLRLRALQRVMDCLPRRCRTIFRLFHIEGLSHAEIAEKLGISRGTVAWHMARAYEEIWILHDALTLG